MLKHGNTYSPDMVPELRLKLDRIPEPVRSMLATLWNEAGAAHGTVDEITKEQRKVRALIEAELNDQQGFKTVAENMVKATLHVLSESDKERLITAAHNKPYIVPSDLLFMCEGMIDEEGRLDRDIQEVLKRS